LPRKYKRVVGISHVSARYAFRKKNMIEHGRNREGLTWVEWRLAAKFVGEEPPRSFTAWQNGEDPTEWAADLEEHTQQAISNFTEKEFVYTPCVEDGPGEYNVVMPVEWKPFDRAAFPRLLTHTRWTLTYLKVGESALLSTIYNPQKQTFYAVRRTK
jgi:hypothetical protein